MAFANDWSRLRIRWIDGIDARHAGEPAGFIQNAIRRNPVWAFPSTPGIAAVFLSSAVRFLIWELPAGKGQSELGMPHLVEHVSPGDIFLADRLMVWKWTEMLRCPLLPGVDSVKPLHVTPQSGFSPWKATGQRGLPMVTLAQTDEALFDRPGDLQALPESLMIRECRVRIEQPGFRVKTLIVATTLPDADELTKDDLAQLYRAERRTGGI